MPDKRTPCGSGCRRCWHNKLKHGCPQVRAYCKRHAMAMPRAVLAPEEPMPPPPIFPPRKLCKRRMVFQTLFS